MSNLATFEMIVEFTDEKPAGVAKRLVKYSVNLSETPETIRNRESDFFPRRGETKDLQIVFWREQVKPPWSPQFRDCERKIACGYYLDEIPRAVQILSMALKLGGKIIGLKPVQDKKEEK